ncbi:deoxyribonuclease IV [Halobacillus salinarum]|uniref:Deoxyribonuclease IV n=2 Tax=Halobacillus salinarum TaxID=2932257 RepID=A0ABY4EPP0_9BACI|nr:deoxyribonuclease IV [Halobacillus salinarum]
MKFGSHVSIRNGYLSAAKHAFSMNASAFQYFPKNPRSLSAKNFNKEDAALCSEYCKVHSMTSVSHSPYPTSLTPQDSFKRNQVVKSLLNDLEISEACGSLGTVVHFGKLLDVHEPLASYQLMIDVLDEVLNEWTGSAKILLENMAGKPGSIGTTLEELTQVRNLCGDSEKIGFCLDTCHAFASGLWNGGNWQELEKKGRELGFWDNLGVIHLNNSNYDTGSGKDRHANIFGQGYIREEQFSQFMRADILKKVPFILETPKDVVSHEEEILALYKKWGD